MAIIDPEGLFNGDRLRRCSNVAQLHWPRLYLASDGFGRLELNYAKMLRAYPTFTPLPTEAELQAYLEEYATNFLLFVYQADGQLWGQWDTPDEFLPRYKTSSDRRSPIPPQNTFADWKRQYREQSRRLPKSFGNFSEGFQRDAYGGGVGGGEGIGGGVGGGGGGADEQTPPPPDPPVQPTPRAQSGEPVEIATLTTLSVWQRDESYGPLVAAWRAAMPNAIDEDFERNHKLWLKLDEQQRQQAIANLRESVRLGVRTSTTLRYWLTEDYKRLIDVAPAGSDNVQARNQQRRDRVNQMTKALMKERL